MRVLVLGAGASHRAGYPLAGDLLPSVEKAALSTMLANFRAAWEGWTEAREALPKLFRDLLSNPNPEVSFSLLDLIDIAADEESWGQYSDALKSKREGLEIDLAEYNRHWESELYQHRAEVHQAKASLLECLKWYFSDKHHFDSEHRQERDYLRDLLSGLQEGDVVLTLNWDTTAERSLGELGYWNPTTGYGFDCPLYFLKSPKQEVPAHAETKTIPSRVSVLKLHGSFGWYAPIRGDFYFGSEFLRWFGFSVEEEPASPRHPKDPEFGPDTDPVLLYPSFLKPLEGIELRTIWYKAKCALDRAECVEILGYSLPQTDTAVRALLNVLRFRLGEGTVKVRVSNPNKAAQSRWRDLLGESAKIDSSRL